MEKTTNKVDDTIGELMAGLIDMLVQGYSKASPQERERRRQRAAKSEDGGRLLAAFEAEELRIETREKKRHG